MMERGPSRPNHQNALYKILCHLSFKKVYEPPIIRLDQGCIPRIDAMASMPWLIDISTRFKINTLYLTYT